MDLLDKYVAEVGKYLPRRTRADIEAEIRSTLEDMLEERTGGGQASEETVSALLKEYGAPRQVAASYGAVQYLIGPRLYPTFVLVLQIAFTVLGMLALIGFGFSVIRAGLSGPEMSAALAQAAGQLINGLFGAFGNIVFIFAILDRTLPASALGDGKDKTWDPADLAKEPDPDRVKYAELIASVFFTVVFVIILNRYPQLVGFGFVDHGQWVYVPMLSPAFFAYLPWINVLSLLGVLLNLWLLRQGYWNTPTRILSLVLKLSAIALALALLAGPPILAIESASLPDALAKLDKLTTLFSFISIPILLAMILGEGIEAIQLIRRLFAPRVSMPFEVRK